MGIYVTNPVVNVMSVMASQDVGKPISQVRADLEATDKVMGDAIHIEDGLLNITILESVRNYALA